MRHEDKLTGFPGYEPAHEYLALIHDPCDEEWKSAGIYRCTESCLPALVKDAVRRNRWIVDRTQYRQIYPGGHFIFMVDMPDEQPHMLTEVLALNRDNAVDTARSIYGDIVDVCEIIETSEAHEINYNEML